MRVREPLIAAALALLLHAAIATFGAPGAFHGVLVDSDCYAHLMRIERLLATGDWWDGRLPLLDAPEGLAMHWTRLFDLVVLLAALPLMPFMAPDQALYWGGALAGPLLQAVAAALVAWAARPYLGRRGCLLAVVLFLAQSGVWAVYQIGRIDHHGLHLTLALATLAPLLVWSVRRHAMALPLVAGLAAAAGLWVGAEALMTIAVAGGALGLTWLAGERASAAALVRFAAGLAAGTLLAMVAERPPADWLAVELDRISLVHVVLVLLLLAAAALIGLADRHAPSAALVRRMVVAAVASVLVLVPMALLFPVFFAGPYGAIDPRVAEIFLANVREAEPLLARGTGSALAAVYALGALLFALPWAVWQARRGAAPRRVGWLVLALAMAVYVAATLHQMRVLAYAQMALVVPWAGVAMALGRGVRARIGRPWNMPATVLAVAAVLFAPSLVAALLVHGAHDRMAMLDDRCDWPAFSDWLAASDPAPGRTVATNVFPGPEIAWRTGYGVISAPYHRNADGILDVDDLLRGPPEQGLEIARRRHLGLVVLCALAPGHGGHAWYLRLAGNTGLYGLLASGRPPPWLTRIGTDDPRLTDFLVFVADPD